MVGYKLNFKNYKMDLKIISDLQGKTEILTHLLEDLKEKVLSPSKESPIELSALIRATVIAINYILSNSDILPSKMNEMTVKLENAPALKELKTILFGIDGINDSERKVRTRKREIVMSRQIIMSVYFSAIKRVTLQAAADLYGMDHCTVLHACKSISNLRETDSFFEITYSKVWEWAKKQNTNFRLQN